MERFAVGQPVPRTEDPRLLKGGGRFTDDVHDAHLAHAVVVRSVHAHADIRAIDTAAALAAPGVLAVLTGEDYAADGLGGIVGPSPRQRRDGAPMYRPPRPALTRERVRYVGQPVALVVAASLAQAKDAAERVTIDYAPRAANTETASARQPGTPAIWSDCPDNEGFYHQVGDRAAVEAAIAGAAHVVRQRIAISRVLANTLEPRGAIGRYDAADERYTIHAGHQRPYAFRTSICRNTLHIDENQLRLVTGDVGGSFGMKGSIYPELILVAWAAKRVGRPVKWIAERSEGFVADDHARDNVTDAALALDAEGRMLALKVETLANLGAYVSFLGMGPPTGNLGTLAGVYTLGAIHAAVSGVFTNTQPTSPYRGAGRPEAAYVIEHMIDLAARTLGMDRAELRRRNMIAPAAMPYQTALTFKYDSGEFAAVMAQALADAGYDGAEDRRTAARARGRLRGLGLACTVEQAAAPQSETAELRFDPSGTVTLLVGTAPHGQGHETIYKQILADALALDPRRVRLIEGDTDKVPFGTGTGGSRSATIGGAAVHAVAAKTLAKARRIAAHLLEAAEADVAFAAGRFHIAGTDRALDLDAVVAAAFNPTKLPKGFEPGLYEIATHQPSHANYPNACHVCEVEIDPDTGALALAAYHVCYDVGTELNPLLVRGQIQGGIAQGLGQAVMERAVFDAAGQLLSGSFMDYAMPRADDLCAIGCTSRPVPTPHNPLGVKGAGEVGTVGGLPAVLSAVHDALAPLGITHFDMPASPERLWRAIHATKAGRT